MLRIGLVGLGKIASVHAHNISQNPRLKLAAIHDPFSDRRETFAKQYGARIAASLQDLVTADDVDAVIIASPTDTHCDVAVATALAGKPIYCEKPIDLNIVRAKTAVDAIRTAGVPVMMGFNRRYDRSHASVQQEVVSGRLGRLQIVQMTSRGPQSPPSPEYIRSSGGFFRDKGVHFFDLLRFITGDEPVEIVAMGGVLSDPYIGELGDFDTFVATLRMRSGAFCQIDNTRRASYGYDERIEAFGTSGMAESTRLPETRVFRTSGHGLVTSDFPQNISERVGGSYALALDAFATRLLDGTGHVPTVDDGLAAQVIAEAATLSAMEKRVVAIGEIEERYGVGGN
jgi:myo-inositol 2-dehydrogenase/D-chiro-inositol 1-dehydrogenase